MECMSNLAQEFVGVTTPKQLRTICLGRLSKWILGSASAALSDTAGLSSAEIAIMAAQCHAIHTGEGNAHRRHLDSTNGQSGAKNLMRMP